MLLCFILCFVGILTPLSSQEVLELFPEFAALKNSVASLNASMQEKVAVTACVPARYYTYPSRLPFMYIKSQTGQIDTDALKDGYFKCPSAGLYMASFTMVSGSSGANFVLLKNDKLGIYHFISTDDNHDSGTSVMAMELNVNDTVSVKVTDFGRVAVNSAGSCLTVMKIK